MMPARIKVQWQHNERLTKATTTFDFFIKALAHAYRRSI